MEYLHMNKLSMTLTAVAAALVIAPSLALAGSPNPLADQCFKAFEAKLTEKFTPAPKVLDTRLLSSPFYSGLEQSNVFQYTMTATNPKNHAEVLKASCIVNNAGSVVSLTEIAPGSL
jgi:hypothetical protein